MNEYGIKLKADRSGFTGEMKATADDVKLVNDALRTTEVAAKELGAALRQMDSALDRTGSTARKAGADSRQAAQDTRALGGGLTATGAAARSSAAGINTYDKEVNQARTNTRGLGQESKSLYREFVSLKGIIAGLGVYTLGASLKNTLADFQDTRTMLQGLTADARDYQNTQQYLITVAENYSGRLNVVSDSYARLLALRQADIVSTQESQQLLEGLLNARAQLKASNEQLGLVYYGLSQALSQPIVHAAELMQVMEPLPGLLNHMDAAAGLTAGGFRNMVLAGEVTSDFFKTTLIEALEEYDGAATRTFQNISAVQNRIGTEYQLLVASLEEPINSVIGNTLVGIELGLKAINEGLPTFIELTGDAVAIAAVFGGIKLAAWMHGIAAGSVVAHGALTMLEVRMITTMGLARGLTVGLGVLRGAMTFLGGPLGVATLAASAVLLFGTNSNAAELRAAGLRQEVDALTESFRGLTLVELDRQIADQVASMEQLAQQRDSLVVPAQTANASGPWGFSSGMAEDMQAMQQYRQQWDALDAQLNESAVNLAALAGARIDAAQEVNQAEAESLAALSKAQQDLLDKYLPLEKLTRDYTTNLATLNAIEATSIDEAARKQRAIEMLNAVYADEVRELTGVTKAEEEAAKAREKTLQQINSLIDTHAPLQNAQATYLEQLLLLTQARDEDLLSLENYYIAVANVAEAHSLALNPGAEVLAQLRQELTAVRLNGVELEFYNRTRNLSTEQIELHGQAIRDLVNEIYQEETALEAAEKAQRAYEQTTKTLIDDLQRTWGDYLEQIYRDHTFTFESIGDAVVDIWISTIARMQAQNMADAFAGVLPGASGATGPAGTTGSGTGINYGQLASVVGGGVSSVLGASIAKNMAPVYEGGKLISEGAKSLDFSMSNIGTNLMAGFAGGQIGTKLGEAMFGKQAQSGYGATAGAIAGSLIPGVGTFLGALAGGALDAIFGGDGYKRSTVGFDTGRDSVKSGYYTGTRTLEGGLTVNTINRRGDQALTDQIVNKAAEIAAYIAGSAAGVGGKLNAAGMQLNGVGGDYGDSTGSFVGLRSGDGQDTQAALDAMFASFSQQLINHIEGIDDDVREAMRSATGTADEVLKQFDETIKINQLVKSGALDQFGEQVDFAFGQQLVQAAGSIEALTAATSAWNNTVADSAQFQEDTVNRLRTAVGNQFTELGLELANFGTINQYRDHFEELRGTMEATDVVKFIQAGNALSLLIEQESQLARVRTASMAEQLATAEGLYDEYSAIRSQAQALNGTIANDIYGLRGANVVDLRAQLNTGNFSEQIDAVNRLRQAILDQHSEELRAREELHKEALRQFEQQREAARSIGQYLDQVLASDLSPLSVADRLDQAQQYFDNVVQRALAGDSDAARQAQSAFEQFAKLNQTANASSVGGVELFYAAMEKLQSVQSYLGNVAAPVESPVNTATTINELIALQGELNRIQAANAVDLVSGLGSLKLLLEQLPEKIALALKGSLPNALATALQIGANLGVLSDSVRAALGLLPQKNDLTSVGIAEQIESLTLLSQHPQLLGEKMGTLSDMMGALMMQAVQNGVSTHLLADLIRKIPGASSAANQWLNNNNLGNLKDYESASNPQLTNEEINNHFLAINGAAATEKDAVDAVMAAALAAGVGSAQLAGAIGYSQEDILTLAKKYGYASFDVGTDRVTQDQFARIHKEEIIFNPAESGQLRKAVIESAEQRGNAQGISQLTRAVERQSGLLEALLSQGQQISGEQARAFADSSRSITEAVDRLTREMEDAA